MPTKRTRIARQPIATRAPAWVERYVATGEEPPDDGGRDRDEFLGWYFFGETVPGLPDPRSEAASLLRARR